LSILLFISSVLSNPWPQPNYDWKQQGSSPYKGPEYFPYISLKTIIEGPTVVGAVANEEIVYALQSLTVYEGYERSYGLITAVNATTLEILWQEQTPAKESSYLVSNPVVNTNGSLLFGVLPARLYHSPTSRIFSIPQISSEGKIENVIDIADSITITQFFLGPQNEIIGWNQNNYWHVITDPNTGSLPGIPLACDDNGGVYVLNGNQLYKAQLSNPSRLLWSTCPGPYCHSDFYLSKAAISQNQSSIICSICKTYFDGVCFLISINAETGDTEWEFVIYQGPIYGFIVSEEYIYVNYGYPSSLTVVNMNGFSIETSYASFVSNMIGSNGNAIFINNTFYQTIASTGPRGDISSSVLPYSYCYEEDTQIFYTSISTIWYVCSQMLGAVQISLSEN